ncbi:hypothetical protein [Streptomyces sp. NPDC050560]|uniref:hypothetical protein n=1 Tax=Streptomyces sp. NPDC050560 TaxID=3365630 RepID=UPI0037957975
MDTAERAGTWSRPDLAGRPRSTLAVRRRRAGGVRTCVSPLPRRGEAAPPDERDPEWNVVRGED